MPQATSPAAVPHHPVKTAGAAPKMVSLEIRRPPVDRVEEGFFPFSMLLGRLVQSSYNSLREMIDGIAAPGMSEGEKKKRIVEYAMEARFQFTKLYVLVQWARRADDVHRVIDLKALMDKQVFTYNRMSENLFYIRRGLTGARIPNPDIATALEVLSTGDAKLDIMKQYIPPPKLTAEQILKTLRHINGFLAIRLGLHENLPAHFRNYRIDSGRATFTVKDEFEVDVSIGDENFESQLYVIDLRLLFEPAPTELPDSIRHHIEATGNIHLKNNGLQGLYEFLHEFCMTTKITTLLRQTDDMLKGRWTDNLRVQLIKRTLVLQYWPNKGSDQGGPENKTPNSWIEVGLRRGKGNNPSRIGVRWMRENKMVKDQEVPIDVAKLSAESLMKTVVAMHTNHILTNIRNKVAATIGPKQSEELVLKTDSLNSFENFLEFQLTPSRKCRLLIEPITGRFALKPPSHITMTAEMNMNMAPAKADEMIIRLRMLATQEEVAETARNMGWEMLRSLKIRKEQIKEHFPLTTKYVLYMRRKGWCKNWVVTFILEEQQMSWWITEISETANGHSIVAAQKIPMKGSAKASFKFLTNLEKMAAGLISHFIHARELTKEKIQHTFRPSETVFSPMYTTAVRIPDLYVRFSKLLPGVTWAMDLLKICFHGLGTHPDGQHTLIVVGRTKHPMTQLGDTPLTQSASDVSFHAPSGSFIIRLTAQIGTSLLPTIREKLTHIHHLIAFITIIRQFKLNCTSVTLSSIAFHLDPSTTIEILTNTPKPTLRLPPDSPQLQLLPYLQHSLETKGLESVIKSLLVTLPLMRAYAALPTYPYERFLFVRSLEWLRIVVPSRSYCVDLRLRAKRSKLLWHVTDVGAGTGAGAGLQEGGFRACEGLREVWAGKGEGWFGLGEGAAGEAMWGGKEGGVGELVRVVDAALNK